MYFKRITIDAPMNRKLKIFLQMESIGIISMDWIQPIHTAGTHIKNTAEIHKYKHYYLHFDRQSLFIFAKLLFHFNFAFSLIRNIYKSERNITGMFLHQLKWRDGKQGTKQKWDANIQLSIQVQFKPFQLCLCTIDCSELLLFFEIWLLSNDDGFLLFLFWSIVQTSEQQKFLYNQLYCDCIL